MPTKILDHGYVAYVEHWGSDERIIEAARMSTDKGFQGWGTPRCECCDGVGSHIVEVGRFHDCLYEKTLCDQCGGTPYKPGDEKLLKFLWDNKHHTPFEMAGLTIEVQAPIFVFREWHRHRTQSYNELSARYTELPDLTYRPAFERLLDGAQSATNKQLSEGRLPEETVCLALEQIDNANRKFRESYEELLRLGVSRELARIVTPVAQYSRMRASANLRNWLHFATLRTGGGAQFEIRQYAEVVAALIAEHFPRTYALWKG